ncbi:ABC1 family-domain-containing protein, partial [Ochromonadaceae sp. CCMP2298]
MDKGLFVGRNLNGPRSINLKLLGFISSQSSPLSLALPLLALSSLALILYNHKRAALEHPYIEGAAVYDPVSADLFYKKRPLLVLARFFKILGLALGFNLKLLRDWRVGTLKENQPKRATEMLNLLTQMGPTYIKLGQALSIRTDIVPPTYAAELKKLQDAVPPFSTKLARQIICKELQIDDLAEEFSYFSEQPVAAASIGQVYRANLLDGREVAVKVQRPNILPSIGLDLYVMRLIAPVQTRLTNQLNGMTTEAADLEMAYSLVDEWGK